MDNSDESVDVTIQKGTYLLVLNLEFSHVCIIEETNNNVSEKPETKSRKRGRKPSESNQKERNKRNAKKSRKKKKTYIETLEKRVVDLENELNHANAELSRYKTKEHFYQTGDQSGYIELIKTQEILKNKGIELFSKSKDAPLQCLSYLSAT